MSKLVWDQPGERYYEMGISKVVLFPMSAGSYTAGVAWNGVTAITESPSGAEITELYADDRKYAALRSAEVFGATVEAYTYPEEFEACDGSAEVADGVYIGQQARMTFGLCYRTQVGNDTVADGDNDYKLHFIYGATASPSERNFQSVNDSPDAMTFSWELNTTPVEVTGHKPTASLTLTASKVNATKLAELETIIYGAVGVAPRLPLPDEIVALMTGTSATPADPTFVAATGVLTIPETTGVIYMIAGAEVDAGARPALNGGVSVDVLAVPDTGYYFPAGTNTTWHFTSTKA